MLFRSLRLTVYIWNVREIPQRQAMLRFDGRWRNFSALILNDKKVATTKPLPLPVKPYCLSPD